MRSRGPGGRARTRTLTPRAGAFALLLFGVGAAFGLVGSLILPTPAVGSARLQTERSHAVSAGHEAAVSNCVAGSLRSRAAQVLVVGLPGVTSSDEPLAQEVLALGVGGVFVNDSNVFDSVQIRTLSDGLRAASKLPLMVATDEESGRVSSFRALIGATSSPRTMAATQTLAEARAYAEQMGSQLAALGVNTDLAPVADLDAGLSSGLIGDRSFSSDPLVAAEYAEAFARGLSDAGVVPVVKHFPGHGGTVTDVHKRDATIGTTLEDLLSADVMPFVGLIEAGAPIVMVGHPRYLALDPQMPASLSPATYRLLRDLGFEGVALTDSIGMGAIHRRWDFPEAAVKSLAAGADAVLATDGTHTKAMVRAIVRAVKRGTLDENRLDEAVARMLTLKGVDPAELTCGTAGPRPTMARRSLLAAGRPQD